MKSTRIAASLAIATAAGAGVMALGQGTASATTCYTQSVTRGISVVCQGGPYREFRAVAECRASDGRVYLNRRAWRAIPGTSTATCSYRFLRGFYDLR